MDDLVDMITLENLEQKMPRWDRNSSNNLYALVDMGSNGIRFSISDLGPPHPRMLKCIYRERAAISLFDALGGTSSLFSDETIRVVSETLARFRTIAIDDYRVPLSQLMVFATEAMRRAQNATSMLKAIEATSPGLRVHILTPQVETLFGAVGAGSGFVTVKGLFLDLGGGSVQMTFLDTNFVKLGAEEGNPGQEVAAALAGQSLPFGAARLIKTLENSDAEAQAAAISDLGSGLGEAFRNLCARFPSLAAAARQANEGSTEGQDSFGIDIYLCGGGFRGYGSMLMYNHPIQPYPIPSMGAFAVPGALFGKTKEVLEINKSFDSKIFGMSKRRRAQFPAIVAVVDALIAAVPPIRSVTFCAGGNREGALMMTLPRDIRERNPLAIYQTSVGDPVASASVQDVFDTLQSAFPPDLNLTTTATIFGFGLVPFYASQIWECLGRDAAINASTVLQNTVHCPDGPGLTHLSRAVLGVTLCARWGAGLGPIDHQLHRNLRALMESSDPDSTFWADYTGAVTAAMVMLIPRWPKSRQAIYDNVRFRSTAEHGKKLKIHLEISISERAVTGVDLDNFHDLFKKVGKKHDGKKVTVTVNSLPQ